MARFSKINSRRKEISSFRNPGKCKVTRKTRYRNEKDASRGMMRLWSHDTIVDMLDIHTYYCEHCGGWHIGHISKFQARMKNETPAQVHP